MDKWLEDLPEGERESYIAWYRAFEKRWLAGLGIALVFSVGFAIVMSVLVNG